jgi:hypothetical protein
VHRFKNLTNSCTDLEVWGPQLPETLTVSTEIALLLYSFMSRNGSILDVTFTGRIMSALVFETFAFVNKFKRGSEGF